MKIEHLDISQIKPNPKNPRTITSEKLKSLVRSIKDFPQMLELRPLVVDKKGVVIGGNMRLAAAKEAGLKKIPVMRAESLTPAQVKEFIIKDNVPFGEWDWDVLKDWDAEILEKWGLDVPDFSVNEQPEIQHGALSELYGIPPFSVIDLKSGLMLEKARKWKDYGIESEKGRDDNLTYQVDHIIKNYKGLSSLKTTSIFNPALAELMVLWYSNENDKIIDPWAGGSVRGIVSAVSGRKYHGIDISETQILENQKQLKKLKVTASYTIADSSNVSTWKNLSGFDLMIGCPPYGSLEVYSNNPKDMSNMRKHEFDAAYSESVKHAVTSLKENRFACIVVGDYREKGELQDFIGTTIKAFQAAGAKYISEAVILTPIGTAAIRSKRVFQTSRKLTKVHQNMLVFVKGDAVAAAKRLTHDSSK